jgi:hypothetical protein
MPGWGIVADLTPPELVESRRLRHLRKLLAGVIGFVLVLCALGYVYAWRQHSAASDSLDAANARHAQLTAQQARYAGVTNIESISSGIQAKITSLMQQDVDVARFVAAVREAAPTTVAITQLQVTFSSGSQSTAPGGVQQVDGHAVIGKVTLSGSGHTLNDLASFVDRLSAVPGVADIFPGSNATGDKGSATTFNVTFDMTDQLYSHRYDASNGSK